jgi:hypothetical protein
MDNLRLAIINHIEDLKADFEREKLLELQAESLGHDCLVSYRDGRRDTIQKEINTLLGLLEETA